MTYELQTELKNAGFPSSDGWQVINGKWWLDDNEAPTLSELIEACGGVLLWGCKPHGYFASKQFCPVENKTLESVIEADAQGSTPEEAVARLWLALNKSR